MGSTFTSYKDPTTDLLNWNGPVARFLISDKYSLSIGGDFAFIIGAGAQPVTFSILTRGGAPGLYLTPTFDVNGGLGAFVSGGFSFSRSLYTGDPRKISSSMLTGVTRGGMATGGILGDLSIGASYSNANDGFGFINASVGLGIGFGAFVGYQYQNTPAAIKLIGK